MDREYTGGSGVPGNFPSTLTSLVGRQRELGELDALLRRTRMLTLTGTGGSGKTRLSLALAEVSRGRFRYGAWWVDLSNVTSDEFIAGTVASALDIAQSPGRDTAAGIARHLQTRAALLIFDNCEQVVRGCAGFLQLLLATCPDVSVIATSREVLGVSGEVVFPVAGLRLPARDDDTTAEAVELFIERARAMTPGFTVAPANREAVVRLCRQLDGLPLAIELAAARAGILGVAEISGRLSTGPGILRHPSRGAPDRHQTLRATLDWSYRLLAGHEQILFRRLSCFSGSFTLRAAETVVAGGCIEADAVVGLIATLVDKSLVLAVEQNGDYRYRMLETIRQYSASELAGSGEEPMVYAAHAAYYLRLAERAHTGLEGVEQARWLSRLELEHDNLRAVLRRAMPGDGRRPRAEQDHDVRTAARLAALLWRFWYRRGYYDEARSWLERASTAALGEPVATPVKAATLTGAGVLAFLQCDYAVAAERLTKARALFEEENDRAGLASTLQRLGSIAREEGRYSDARRLHEESMAIWAELGDAAGVAASQDYLGFVAWLAGDMARADELCGRAADAFRAAGLRQETAAAMINQGIAAHFGGDPERGTALLHAGLDISMRLGYQEGIAWALHELSIIVAEDDQGTAADMLTESLETHAALGDRWRVASVVETIAEIVVAPADASLAATLLGGSAALRKALGAPIPPAERPAHDACVRALRESLGQRHFRGAWQRGLTMPLDELVDLALQAIGTARNGPDHADTRADRLGEYGLTEREREVLQLLSQGLTNREIAKELLISTGTAGVHVSSILRKLGVSSRIQAAGIANGSGGSLARS
ncbi:MAG: tetratricopeptide repeat protein [Streptosporangiaceae bacterium]